MQLPSHHPHPATAVSAGEGWFVLGSCTAVLKQRGGKRKKKVFNELVCSLAALCFWCITEQSGSYYPGSLIASQTELSLKWSFLIDFVFFNGLLFFSGSSSSVSLENDTLMYCKAPFAERRKCGMLFFLLEVIFITWNKMIFLAAVIY